MRHCDYSIAKKDDKVLILLNIVPYQQNLAEKDDQALRQVAEALVKGPGLEQFPKIKQFKVIVAEVPERDNYDLPSWYSLKVVVKYLFKLDKSGVLKLESETK